MQVLHKIMEPITNNHTVTCVGCDETAHRHAVMKDLDRSQVTNPIGTFHCRCRPDLSQFICRTRGWVSGRA